jgi:mono/diheme cytochrome c family protein
MHARRVVWRLLVAFAASCLAGPIGRAQAPVGGTTDAARLANPVPSTPESIASGLATYQRYCRSCHLATGRGGSVMREGAPPASDLTDAQWDHGGTDADIFTSIKNGIPPELNMEPWGDRIDDTNLWDLVNYVRSLARSK